MEPKALQMLIKIPATELHTQTLFSLYCHLIKKKEEEEEEEQKETEKEKEKKKLATLQAI